MLLFASPRLLSFGLVTDETVSFRIDTEIRRVEDDQRLIFGWASVFTRADGTAPSSSYGDRFDTPEAIEAFERAVYQYMLRAIERGDDGVADDQHERFERIGRPVESIVFTDEKLRMMGAPPDALRQGWWIGLRIDDDSLWDDIKRGEKRMLSIVGRARRIKRKAQ